MARHREDTPGYKGLGSTGALVGIGSEDYAARCLRSQTQPGRGTDDIELLCGKGGKNARSGILEGAVIWRHGNFE